MVTVEQSNAARRYQQSFDQEKQSLLDFEHELQAKAEQAKAIRAKNFYERVVKDNRRTAKSVRELYAMCESLSTTVKEVGESLQLPEIATCKKSAKKALGGSFSSRGPPTGVLRGSLSGEYQQSFSNGSLTERREPVKCTIEKSRGILLAKLAMQDKLRETSRMREYIERKESLLRLNKELYDQDCRMIEDYIEHAKRDTALQRIKTAHKVVRRERQENNLNELKRQQILLRKEIDDNKEKYRMLVECKEFMLMLDPELKKRLRKKRKFFMTQSDSNCEAYKGSTDPMLKDLKDEFDLSENDSNTEIPVKFSSVEDIIDILLKMESDNLMMINESQRREEELDRSRKDIESKLAAKKDRLAKAKEAVEQSKLEEARKQEQLKELKTQSLPVLEESTQPATKAEEVKREIEMLIKNIYHECVASKKVRGEDKRLSAVQQLEGVTNFLMRLKEIRTYKINKAMRVGKKGPADLFKREEEERKRAQESAAKEKNRMIAEELERRRSEAKKWDNIIRTKKTMKEMMQRIKLVSKEKKTVVKEEQEVDDTFNDRYFI
eukprot:TRINITY_DN5114_c0_g3_i1.p1 TRINITY_DN5114_c0_g3~~TRINITY_DN5114_c0_g3_i1.p1  ORF type:complete len:552 (+),score=185.41 TRINITY_DN5114_c0_g3_i1:131-1786(+)